MRHFFVKRPTRNQREISKIISFPQQKLIMMQIKINGFAPNKQRMKFKITITGLMDLQMSGMKILDLLLEKFA